jgi:hypothetical protein
MKIAILGRAGSGKDTVANYLVSEHGFEKHAFSEGLYKICREYYGMTVKDRGLLQEVGEAMRSIDPDVFVKYLGRSLKNSKNIVISDVRFVNEYKTLKDLGFKFYRVKADLNTRLGRIQERDKIEINQDYINKIETHTIETQCDGFEAEILENNKDYNELFRKIDEIVNKLKQEEFECNQENY